MGPCMAMGLAVCMHWAWMCSRASLIPDVPLFVGEGSCVVAISCVKRYACDPQCHGDDVMTRHHGIGYS